MHRLVGVRGERAARRGDVRRLRVVDEAHAVALGDELEPVRHAGEGAQSLGDRSSAIPAARAAAVAAAAFSRLCAPRISGSAGSSSSAENSIPSRPSPARDDLRARALEDAQLRVAVGLERPVPVEVVGLEVEQHRDVAGELVHVLELERRELADDPLRRARSSERRADVAGDRDVTSRGAEDRAEQLGRRRLAVRAGDADEARPPGSSRKPSSTSDHTGIPRRAPRRRAAPRPGTPGRLDDAASTPSSSDRSSSLPSVRSTRTTSSPRSAQPLGGRSARTARGRRRALSTAARMLRVVLVEEREAGGAEDRR